MDRDDRVDVERLRVYWDGLIRGDVSEPTDVDPATAAVVRQLHAWYHPPLPTPAFRRQLEAELMGIGKHSLTVSLSDRFGFDAPLTVSPNGRSQAVSPARPWSRGEHAQPPWAAALATAALVLVTLVGSYFVFGRSLHPSRDTTPLTGMAGTMSTPSPPLPPGVTADTILVQGTLADIPAEADWLGVDHVTVAPGAEWPLSGSLDTSGVGPALYRVERGTLRVQADGPIVVSSATTATATPVPAGTDIDLSAGDGAAIGTGVASRWRNTGTEPAVVVDAGVVQWGQGEPPAGVAYDPAYLGINILHPPAALAELEVRQLTLEPGARLGTEPGSGLKVLGLTAGRLEVAMTNRSDATLQTDPSLLLAGNWLDLNREVCDANGAHYLPSELRNTGNQPAVLLLVTVVPLGPGGSPLTTVNAAAGAAS